MGHVQTGKTFSACEASCAVVRSKMHPVVWRGGILPLSRTAQLTRVFAATFAISSQLVGRRMLRTSSVAASCACIELFGDLSSESSSELCGDKIILQFYGIFGTIIFQHDFRPSFRLQGWVFFFITD